LKSGRPRRSYMDHTMLPSVSVELPSLLNGTYDSVVVVTCPESPIGPVVNACTLMIGRPCESLVMLDMLPSGFVVTTVRPTYVVVCTDPSAPVVCVTRPRLS